MTTTTSLHDSCCCSPPIEYSGSPSPLETPMADHAASDTAMPTQPEHSGRLAEVGGNPLTPRSEQDKPETAPKLTPDPTFGNPLPMGMSTAGGRTGAWLDGSMATSSSCPPTRWNCHAAHALSAAAHAPRSWVTRVCSCWCTWRHDGGYPPPDTSRLTAKLTAKPYDHRGPWRTTLDGYRRPELRKWIGR